MNIILRMAKNLTFLIAGAFAVIILFPIYRIVVNFGEKNFSTIEMGAEKFKVEVADTSIKKQLGLSGRKSLDKDKGMIFPFSEIKPQVFWMKGMLIPIDIIWARDGVIVGVSENATPEPGIIERNLTVYESHEPVNLVIEVSSGTVKRLGLVLGDKIKID